MLRYTFLYTSTYGYTKRVVLDAFDYEAAQSMLMSERGDVGTVTSVWSYGERIA